MLVGLVLAGALFAAAPAGAQSVEALEARELGEGGPVLDAGTVVWSRGEGGDGVRVSARAAAGGPVAHLGRASSGAASAGSWRLAAGAGRVGLRVVSGRGGVGALLSAPFGGAPLRRSVPRGATMAADRDFWAWSGGYVTLERSGPALGAVVTGADGSVRRLALPAGARVRTLAVAGSLAAVSVGQAVVVFDLATGAEVRRVALDAMSVGSLSVDPSGALAATGESEYGVDVLAWAPVGAGAFEVVTTGGDFGLVSLAGGRIAYVASRGLDEGARAVVVEPRPGSENPTVLFRGPPAFQIETLDFNGSHVAWSSQACQFLSLAAPAASGVTVPAGPCARSDVAVTVYSTPTLGHRNPSLPVIIRCLTAPTAGCRVDVRAYEIGRSGSRLGRARATVPRGARRTVRVPIGARAAARLRRADIEGGAYYVIRTIDPDGRTRQVGPL
ncbi:hypothetical protein DVA67_002480 [Solirubrobacter sp. CPCC 204708]|uniref:Uncharacterized protein n=1 Tax=Solirubrobacter deserti TaxID=2282478 RepID=A0ABT4RRL3_9ACTN|nr:hypothetical protein [Solirubrobacter deserti]MBE2314827.1 hypothetical protein [Solirubrobacter deserti]MDA0141236.1 hypothetical protein [Solirubrobacter deserti]